MLNVLQRNQKTDLSAAEGEGSSSADLLSKGPLSVKTLTEGEPLSAEVRRFKYERPDPYCTEKLTSEKWSGRKSVKHLKENQPAGSSIPTAGEQAEELPAFGVSAVSTHPNYHLGQSRQWAPDRLSVSSQDTPAVCFGWEVHTLHVH